VKSSHRFEESDELRLVVRAASLAGVFPEAGRALAELVDGTGAAPDAVPVEIAIEARDPPGLVVEWINELIYRAESEGWLGREFEVLECGAGTLRVRARGTAWPARTFPVKAATLDRASVTETPEGVTAEVTLDV
jgi:SHS2 domain-containing protein